ncbi:hypothetical protein Acr_12g0003380 [Actinidia rufa]|uniref:Uncharacterized protein n=1 Tax=Actinidia rufa TaxID=165716 RepID=A0A7J0FIQ8_9ERIC|nr:hypothetical protein Acr_12g0003380 [Actinidia rufa]
MMISLVEVVHKWVIQPAWLWCRTCSLDPFKRAGDYLAKDLRIAANQNEVKAMSTKIKDFEIRQIPREENKKVDAFANLDSAYDFILDRSVHLEFLPNSSIDITKTVCQAIADLKWMDESLPSDTLQAQRIPYRLARFCLLHGTLYKRSFLGPLMRCLQLEESDYILREIHEGISKNHTEMAPMTNPWPFTQWGIDIFEPLPQAPLQRKLLIVAIDY